MSQAINKLLKIASSQIGYLEKKSDKDLDSKTANAGQRNYTKYNRDMHKIAPNIYQTNLEISH